MKHHSGAVESILNFLMMAWLFENYPRAATALVVFIILLGLGLFIGMIILIVKLVGGSSGGMPAMPPFPDHFSNKSDSEVINEALRSEPRLLMQ